MQLSRTIVIIVLCFSSFACISFIRGNAMGRETDPLYIVVTFLVSAMLCVWLVYLNKKNKTGDKR